MEITYHVNGPLSSEELAALFEASGIRRPTGDLPRIQRMIDNANLTITARAGEQLVGVARALTDFSYCCYLSDLAVDRQHQRSGIGRDLVRRVRAEVGPEACLLLLSAPDAMGYYPKIGLEAVHNGWIIKRER